MKLKNKTILVTGADGFIGSHLIEELTKKGNKIKALSFYNSFNYWGWLEDVDCLDRIEVITGDIRDPHFCMNISKGVDVIFNLAALIAIPYSYAAPDSYMDTNIKGTLNLCQASRDNNVKRLIQTSTSEVYGTAQYIPIDEKHPLNPQSPYSASKIGSDAIAMSFYNSFGLPVTIARPFNTYGPRQSARAVIPTIITQLTTNAKKINLGSVTPTRDFNYVKDTCKGLILLAECENATAQTVNIGSNTEISVNELFTKIRTIMKKEDIVLVKDTKRTRPVKSEVQRLVCDNSKLKSLTGYTPDFSIDKGLRLTIEWFMNAENKKKYKPGIYNI